MKLIVGLGNIGNAYAFSRHNAGFLIVDELQKAYQMPEFKLFKKANADISKSEEMILVKPQTFMNASGFAVRGVIDFFLKSKKFDTKNIFVIHDDLDIELGKYKIQFGKGPKVHNGLLSIYQHLQTKNIWHIRVGVDNRNGDRSLEPHLFVLKKMNNQELDQIKKVAAEIVVKIKTYV